MSRMELFRTRANIIKSGTRMLYYVATRVHRRGTQVNSRLREDSPQVLQTFENLAFGSIRNRPANRAETLTHGRWLSWADGPF
jgi:hypothetical protein